MRFPWAAQAACLVRDLEGHQPETVLLLASATPDRLNAAQWLQCNRHAWNIEALHNKLDVSHDEDRSRVRHPHARLVLSLFRRIANIHHVPRGPVHARAL